MSYQQSIAEAIDTTDPDLLAVVERFMRNDHGGTLDSLTPAAFDRAARKAYRDVRQLAGETIDLGDGPVNALKFCCEAELLPVPDLGRLP